MFGRNKFGHSAFGKNGTGDTYNPYVTVTRVFKTPSTNTPFVVPAGVTSIKFDLIGGGSGGYGGEAGSGGAYSGGTISTTPGETLNVIIPSEVFPVNGSGPFVPDGHTRVLRGATIIMQAASATSSTDPGSVDNCIGSVKYAGGTRVSLYGQGGGCGGPSGPGGSDGTSNGGNATNPNSKQILWIDTSTGEQEGPQAPSVANSNEQLADVDRTGCGFSYEYRAQTASAGHGVVAITYNMMYPTGNHYICIAKPGSQSITVPPGFILDKIICQGAGQNGYGYYSDYSYGGKSGGYAELSNANIVAGTVVPFVVPTKPVRAEPNSYNGTLAPGGSATWAVTATTVSATHGNFASVQYGTLTRASTSATGRCGALQGEDANQYIMPGAGGHAAPGPNGVGGMGHPISGTSSGFGAYGGGGANGGGNGQSGIGGNNRFGAGGATNTTPSSGGGGGRQPFHASNDVLFVDALTGNEFGPGGGAGGASQSNYGAQPTRPSKPGYGGGGAGCSGHYTLGNPGAGGPGYVAFYFKKAVQEFAQTISSVSTASMSTARLAGKSIKNTALATTALGTSLYKTLVTLTNPIATLSVTKFLNKTLDNIATWSLSTIKNTTRTIAASRASALSIIKNISSRMSYTSASTVLDYLAINRSLSYVSNSSATTNRTTIIGRLVAVSRASAATIAKSFAFKRTISATRASIVSRTSNSTKTLSAIASRAVSVINSIIRVKSVTATSTSSATQTRVYTIGRMLQITASGIAYRIANIALIRSLLATNTAYVNRLYSLSSAIVAMANTISSVAKTLYAIRTIATSNSSTPSTLRAKTASKMLNMISSSVVSKIANIYKTIIRSSPSAVTVNRFKSAYKTILASGTSIATVNALRYFLRTVSVARASALTVVKQTSFYRALNSVGSRSLQIFKTANINKAISTTNTPATIISAGKLLIRQLLSLVASSVTANRLLVVGRYLNVVDNTSVTMTKNFTKRVLSSVGSIATRLRNIGVVRSIGVGAIAYYNRLIYAIRNITVSGNTQVTRTMGQVLFKTFSFVQSSSASLKKRTAKTLVAIAGSVASFFSSIVRNETTPRSRILRMPTSNRTVVVKRY